MGSKVEELGDDIGAAVVNEPSIEHWQPTNSLPVYVYTQVPSAWAALPNNRTAKATANFTLKDRAPQAGMAITCIRVPNLDKAGIH
jgi:hypothetical protein